MAKPTICGKCHQPMKKGERLKSHWRDLHTENYVAVQKWLGEDEGKLRAAILVAGEGMKGPGAEANLGPEFYNGLDEAKLQKAAVKEAESVPGSQSEVG